MKKIVICNFIVNDSPFQTKVHHHHLHAMFNVQVKFQLCLLFRFSFFLFSSVDNRKWSETIASSIAMICKFYSKFNMPQPFGMNWEEIKIENMRTYFQSKLWKEDRIIKWFWCVCKSESMCNDRCDSQLKFGCLLFHFIRSLIL